MLLCVLMGVVYLVWCDELMMGCVQRRVGPLNVGGYGVLSSVMSGVNLVLCQMMLARVYVSDGYELFPMIFYVLSILNYILVYPLFMLDVLCVLLLLL